MKEDLKGRQEEYGRGDIQLMSRRANGFITKNSEPGRSYRWMDPDTFGWWREQNEEAGEEWIYYNSKWNDMISYVYNEDGFRNEKTLDEITNEPYGVVFGASQIEGIGVPFEWTIAKKLQEKTGHHVYNMGMAGTGMLEVFNNFMNLACNYNPPKWVLMTTNRPSLCTVADPNKPGFYMKVGPWIGWFKKYMIGEKTEEFLDNVLKYYDGRMAVDKHIHEDETYFNIISQMSKKIGTRLVFLESVERPEMKNVPGLGTEDVDWIEVSEEMPGIFELHDHDFMMKYTRYKEKKLSIAEKNDFARDCYHQGEWYNEIAAKRMMELLS